MFFTKIYLLLNICLLEFESKSDKKIIEIDYFGHGIMQHTRVVWNCEFDLHKKFCQFKCMEVPSVCVHEKCYCLRGISRAQPISHKPEEVPPTESSEEEDLLHENHHTNLNYEPKVPNSRPIRRHHIAHFCPNLDEARKCIKKCMVKGKSAFCGKDHVCYCGHTMGALENENKDRAKNATALYVMFKDMYDKYFGEPPREEEEDIIQESE